MVYYIRCYLVSVYQTKTKWNWSKFKCRLELINFVVNLRPIRFRMKIPKIESFRLCWNEHLSSRQQSTLGSRFVFPDLKLSFVVDLRWRFGILISFGIQTQVHLRTLPWKWITTPHGRLEYYSRFNDFLILNAQLNSLQ